MRLNTVSSYFQALLLFCAAVSVNGEDDIVGPVVKRSVSGDSDEEITPEAFKNFMNKVNLLESSITNMTVGMHQLVSQNEELHKSQVEQFERIATEFGKVNEQLSTLGNRLGKFENISGISFDSRTNATGTTESSLSSTSFDNSNTTDETGRTDSSLSGDSCGGVIEEKEFGEIIYKEGKRYSNSENCMWTVVAPDAGMISFHLVTSGFEECCDYITIKSIDENFISTGPPLRLNSLNRIASVSGSRAHVIFSSDSSVTGNGFTLRIEYRTECGGVITADRGVISYKTGLKYLDNERCVWILHSPNTSIIKLNLLEHGFEHCCDYLLVNTIDPETGWIRNDTNIIRGDNKTLTIEESLIVIVFFSDHSNTGNGFSLEFSSSGENPDPEINFIVNHLSEPNGTIEYPSSAWSEGGESNNIIYVVGFSKRVQSSEMLPTVVDWKHGIFQSSTTDSCVYDSLIVYEPDSDGLKARAQFPNQTDCQRVVIVPPENELLTSSHHSFIAIFKPLSNENSNNITRFSFSYDNQPRADSVCGGILEPLEADFGQILYKKARKYSDNENCTWTVQVLQAKTVLFSLIQTGLEECCDHVSVSSCTNRTDSPFHLTSVNRTVSVEGPTAAVTFTSDDTVTGLGFHLRYQKET
ncbi:unnamed protein product [Orchesella dallaii]|uniref:CUB domain-containing protein n=1 Tax=Orchesella dallaii TaxID=48710 RepID=A0ABP1PNL2_9HEXA